MGQVAGDKKCGERDERSPELQKNGPAGQEMKEVGAYVQVVFPQAYYFVEASGSMRS